MVWYQNRNEWKFSNRIFEIFKLDRTENFNLVRFFGAHHWNYLRRFCLFDTFLTLAFLLSHAHSHNTFVLCLVGRVMLFAYKIARDKHNEDTCTWRQNKTNKFVLLLFFWCNVSSLFLLAININNKTFVLRDFTKPCVFQMAGKVPSGVTKCFNRILICPFVAFEFVGDLLQMRIEF